MQGAKKRREIAHKVASCARSKYGELKRRKVRPALDQLVLSLMCCYTSTRRATRALRQLQRAFVDWNEVRISPTLEVARAMASTEWADQSAERIRAVLQSLFEARNVVDLEFLSELTIPQARVFLQSLPGVGRDVADEVLLFSLAAEVLPLSAEAARVCHRMGLIPTDRATRANQKALMGYWEPDLYPALALYFGDEAKNTCREDKPRCSRCGAKSVCPKEAL